jgi:hypothetical protein
MSAIATLAESPQLIKDVFLTQTKNNVGIYGFRFFIRGKPWVVTIDDSLLYSKPGENYLPLLKFAQPNTDNTAIWGPLLEKAWAKIKGSYNTADGGFVETGLRSLIGVPVFSYKVSNNANIAAANTAWQLLKDSETAGYFMGAGTDGGSD